MASKLRRTPLYDGTYSYGPYTNKNSPKHNGLTTTKTNTGTMECGALAGTTPYTNGTSSGGSAGILAANQAGSATVGQMQGSSDRSPAKAGLHVNFQEKGEVKERREKFLTAKYGHHQMSLIRKRLAVEMWLYEEIKKLYETPTKKLDDDEVEVDMDELLDMDSDEERRRHLQKLLIGAKKSDNDVKKFINDLLDKAKTL